MDWSTSCKSGATTLPAQAPEMMQSLLEERFQMKTHREKKEFPVYALVIAKGGPKMKETAPDADPAKPDAKGQDQNYDTAAADSDTAAHSTAILDITAFSLVSPTHGSIRITKEI